MTWNIVKDGPGKKTSELIANLRKHFPVYFYDEENAGKHFPAPKEKTTRTFEASKEAPEKHKNKSFDDLAAEGVVGITIREYLILALQYFEETGKHLDVDNWTLCTGSQYSNGSVPHGDWSPSGGRFFVSWCSRDDRSDDLRARQVLSGTLSLSPTSSPATRDLAKLDLPETLEINGRTYKLVEMKTKPKRRVAKDDLEFWHDEEEPVTPERIKQAAERVSKQMGNAIKRLGQEGTGEHQKQ